MDRADHVDEMSQEEWGRWYARRGRLDIALLLFAVWDPIGVNEEPEAYDEYDSYTANCLQSISHGDAESLAEVLAGIERSKMGFSTPATRLVGAATVIVQGARASAQRCLRSQ
jgi:hypothetical protein